MQLGFVDPHYFLDNRVLKCWSSLFESFRRIFMEGSLSSQIIRKRFVLTDFLSTFSFSTTCPCRFRTAECRVLGIECGRNCSLHRPQCLWPWARHSLVWPGLASAPKVSDVYSVSVTPFLHVDSFCMWLCLALRAGWQGNMILCSTCGSWLCYLFL